VLAKHDLDVVLTRGNAVEARHQVHAAVADAGDRLIGAARNPGLKTWWRSCAKPFQIIPLIESGGFDVLGWGEKELALACASHGGEPEHLEVVERMLSDIGLEEGDLACGAHEPLTARGSHLLAERGARPTRIHNNCSGKHAAMLALARYKGWPIEGYERPEHPVQQAILNQIALWSGAGIPEIGIAVDGCGVVVFGLTLEQMARAFARLGAAAQRGEEIPSRIVTAMTRNPFLVGGTDRFDTVLMEDTQGRVAAKVGAEGVHSVLIPELGIGFALKVEDGSPRAQYPAVIQLLSDLDVLSDPLPQRLAEIAVRPVWNTRGEVVGETRVQSGHGRRSRVAASI
jgi:L-asparaginase II